MRRFLVIWSGQLFSTIGSHMTTFAVQVWLWELTQSVTAFTLLGLTLQIPRLLSSLWIGAIVDRYSRKTLMLLGDSVAATSTVLLMGLYWSDSLALWHLYVTGAINSCFAQLQGLAYSSSVATLVPKDQYVRASSLNACFHYGSSILAPPLAGWLYPQVGLGGILGLDSISFGVGVLTLLGVRFPAPEPSGGSAAAAVPAQWRDGWQYLIAQRPLLQLLLLTSLFWLWHDLGAAVFAPLVLARSGHDTQVLGQVYAAAGISGVASAALIGLGGGPQRKIPSLLWGLARIGLCKMLFGLGRTPLVWLPAQVGSSLNFPLINSLNTSLWLEQIPNPLQGRVFAVRLLARQLVGTGALLLAGPLTEGVLIPLVTQNPLLHRWLDGSQGGGMALLYLLSSAAMVLTALWGYTCGPLWRCDQPLAPVESVPAAQALPPKD